MFVDAAPERVYEYFTRREAIVRWMGDYALLEPERGGRFTVDIGGTPVGGGCRRQSKFRNGFVLGQ